MVVVNPTWDWKMHVGSSTRRTSDFFRLLFSGIINLDNTTQFTVVVAGTGYVADRNVGGIEGVADTGKVDTGNVAGGRGACIEGVVGAVTVGSAAISIKARTIFVGVVIVIVVTDDLISITRVLALSEGI